MAPKTDVIEQLRTQLAAAQEEISLLRDGIEFLQPDVVLKEHAALLDQLAASQAYAEQLREALENHSGNYKLSKAECKIINDLLDKPHDTSALDAYVSEKVKEAGKFDVWKTNPYTKVLETSIKQLTKQRDLAVEAIEKSRPWLSGIANFNSRKAMRILETALYAIKESEEN